MSISAIIFIGTFFFDESVIKLNCEKLTRDGMGSIREKHPV